MVNGRRAFSRVVRPLTFGSMILALLVVVAGCGAGAGHGGGGGASPTGSQAPPPISTGSAKQVALAYFIADNKAQQALDDNAIPALEEGADAIVDRAELDTYAGHQKSFPPYTAGNVTPIVPAHAVPYPMSFLVEAALTAKGTTDNTLTLFLKDSAGAQWRAALSINLGHSAYPDFALDGAGYADELTPSKQAGLEATGAQVDAAFANYLAKPLLGTNAAQAPALSFAPGVDTSQYLAGLQANFNAAKQSGGQTNGYFSPGFDEHTYALSSGGAAALFSQQVQTGLLMGGTSQLTLPQGIDTFVDPGTYTSVSETEENLILAEIPPKPSHSPISIPFANGNPTAATAS